MNEVLDAHVWATTEQAETSTILSGFLSAPKENLPSPMPLRRYHSSAIGVASNYSSGAVQRQIVQQRSESRVLNESFDWNFQMAAANLAPDFRICQFHGCNFHFSSPHWTSWTLPWTVAMIALTIIRFNQTLFLEVKDLSSSPCSKTSSASSCESDFPKSSPWYFHMMAISFVYKDQSYVMFS